MQPRFPKGVIAAADSRRRYFWAGFDSVRQSVLASGIDHHLQGRLTNAAREELATLNCSMHARLPPFKSERFEGEPSYRHEWEPELQYVLYNPYYPLG